MLTVINEISNSFFIYLSHSARFYVYTRYIVHLLEKKKHVHLGNIFIFLQLKALEIITNLFCNDSYTNCHNGNTAEERNNRCELSYFLSTANKTMSKLKEKKMCFINTS